MTGMAETTESRENVLGVERTIPTQSQFSIVEGRPV